MIGVWTRRGWALVRALLCWAAAIACIAAGFLLPVILVGRIVYSATYTAIGGPQHDLSDIGYGLIALSVAVVVGVTAGIIGSLIAAFPALALVGKSGLFNNVRLKRRRKEPEPEEGWPFSPS